MKLILTHYNNKIGLFGIEENKLVKAKLYDTAQQICVGDIYIGKIQKKLPSIQAYFVQIGQAEIFLPFTETLKEYKNGEPLFIQIKKEVAKGKQALGTTKLSLSGIYCVVSLESISIQASSKLKKSEKEYWCNVLNSSLRTDRFSEEEKKLLQKYGVILRTNVQTAISDEQVLTEWLTLTNKLDSLIKQGTFLSLYTKLYQEESLYLSEIKNISQASIEEIITDDKHLYEMLTKSLKTISNYGEKIRFYEDDFSLLKLYSLQSKLEEALERKVWLKCGGFLIIEPTEALTVIDVNSGKYDKKGAAEEYYQKVNEEAAIEIARQISLRNISGIIIIDFINMQSKTNNEKLLESLRNLVAKDTIKTYVMGLTSLGLVEMTREKKEKPLWEQMK